MLERTFAMLKPDVIKQGEIGAVIQRIEEDGFRILGMRMTTLEHKDCDEFYKEHVARPFYPDLVGFITSGPVVLLALEGENAVGAYRDLIGPTNPAEAPAHAIRAQFGGKDLSSNAVHGSDSVDSAKRELGFFFPDLV